MNEPTPPFAPPDSSAPYRRGEVMPIVLVVEDDEETRDAIALALTDSGYIVHTADTGDKALAHTIAHTYDALVLDRLLPGTMEGLDVLTALRRAGNATPVMILSALSAVDERVKGLRAGGDDYLVKPFESIELTARLEALRRRGKPPLEMPGYSIGGLKLDLVSRTVTHSGREIELLPREYRILEYLMRHAGQVIKRTMLFEAVWQYSTEDRTNVIDVHISRLRRKLDPTGSTPVIHTVRGTGYVVHASH